MKLWLLRPIDGLDEKRDPWSPWYDKVFGFVIRAESEMRARELATAKQAGEAGKVWAKNPWLDPAFSTCVALSDDGAEEIVMVDFAAA
jgi:hypothetical protein